MQPLSFGRVVVFEQAMTNCSGLKRHYGFLSPVKTSKAKLPSVDHIKIKEFWTAVVLFEGVTQT